MLLQQEEINANLRVVVPLQFVLLLFAYTTIPDWYAIRTRNWGHVFSIIRVKFSDLRFTHAHHVHIVFCSALYSFGCHPTSFSYH